jgi:nucleoside-diphosphate-sugar epimerase
MSNILLTGASGFLGRQVLMALQGSHHTVATLGRQQTAQIHCDLATTVPRFHQPFHTVIHAAGKAHMVPTTTAEALDFEQVNVQGTKNLCKGFDALGQWPTAFVFVSSVAVYGCDAGEMIAENHPLNGTTPYAKSKIAAESWLTSWCRDHGVLLTILRLPLLIGPQAPGNFGDMVHAIKANRYANIGGGTAKKSMVLASDVANCLTAAAAVGGIYNLTDGRHPSFAQLAQAIAGLLNKSSPRNIPLTLAKLLAMAGDLLGARAPINTLKLKKITATLTFDDSRAVAALGWQPHSVIDNLTLN